MSGLEAIFVTLINFLAALLFGMLGVGAAPVFIPSIQSLGYGIVATVFPLAILLNGINSGFALLPFAKAHSVDWRKGALLSVSGGVLGFFGAYFAFDIPTRTLLYFLVAVLISLSLWIFARVRKEGSSAEPSRRKVAIIALPASLFAGFVGGLLAVGGGGIFMPFLLMTGYKTRKASGTTALVATVISAAGFLGFLSRGVIIPLDLLIYSTLAVVVASILGAWLSIRLAKPSWLRMLLGFILLVSSLKILVGLL